MSFNNLKKNDIIFSESKGSRVFKLISKEETHWVVGDMFTKKMDTLTESDTFKVVKTENKPKPISLVNLLENKEVVTSPTLTEKEVFLVEELKDTYRETTLHDIIASYENGDLYSGWNVLKGFLKVINSKTTYVFDEYATIQYVYCAIENYDNEVTTSTPINRFKLFLLSTTEISDERKYQNWTLVVPASDENMMIKMQEGIMGDFWKYDPDAGWTDYGDNDFLGFDDTNIEGVSLSQFRKPLVL
jgi:hypothetical protein